MTDFADVTESLKRVVARPGTFASLFPETTEDDLVGVLMDGLAEVQLDGMLHTYLLDDDGIVEPDLTRAQVALVVLYAGSILVKAELFNRKTNRRYEASGAVFDETQATNILRDLMRGMEARKAEIREAAASNGAGAAFHMADAYAIRTGALDFAFDAAGGW